MPSGRVRAWCRRHSTALTVVSSLLALGALVLMLAGKLDEFVAALLAAPLWILGLVVALEVIWLVARCEAWHVCIAAAGGSVRRRRLYRAGSIGYLGNLVNGPLGVATRITALRRSAPAEAPAPSVLVAAEMPVVLIEVGLAALMSFTLIGPLGLPWWVPLICLGAAFGGMAAAAHFTRGRRDGFWNGLAVLRGLGSRRRIVALVILTVVIQILRNWLVLHGIGVDASVLDSTALLIGMAAVGLVPVGPTLGTATAVLILGANGVAATAAAGTLLTATAAVGAVCFAAWALLDRMRLPGGTPLPV